MVTKLAELAIVVALITLSQRSGGWENKPLSVVLLVIAVCVTIHWIWTTVGESLTKRAAARGQEANPKAIGKARKRITVALAVALLLLVAYPWMEVGYARIAGSPVSAGGASGSATPNPVSSASAPTTPKALAPKQPEDQPPKKERVDAPAPQS